MRLITVVAQLHFSDTGLVHSATDIVEKPLYVLDHPVHPADKQ
jgi:hypothetical protein